MNQRRKRSHDSDFEAVNEKTPILSKVGNTRIQTGNFQRFDKAKPMSRQGPSIFLVMWRTHRWKWAEATTYKIMGDAFDLLQPFILK